MNLFQLVGLPPSGNRKRYPVQHGKFGNLHAGDGKQNILKTKIVKQSVNAGIDKRFIINGLFT